MYRDWMIVLFGFLFLFGCTKRQMIKHEDALNAAKPPVAVDGGQDASARNGNWRSVAELNGIHFDFDSAEIKPSAGTILTQNAAYLKGRPEQVLVEGHCDQRGTVEYNLALGQRRAEAVKHYYIMLGLRPGRIATISYGKEKPLATGNSEAAWAQNRRAETKINVNGHSENKVGMGAAN